MYYACEINKINSTQKIVERIGEQQETINTVVDILIDYNNNGENDKLIEGLKDLKTSFDKINIEYTFVKPKTDAKTKTTTLQHVTKVNVDQTVLTEIGKKIVEIRESIIN